MTITITKAKAKSKAKTEPTNVIDAVAQKYVAGRLELEAKLAKLAALQKEVEAGEKALLEYVDTVTAADVPTELQVGEYVVKVGAKGRKAVAFDNGRIKKELGKELFDTLAQFKVEDLKKYMAGNVFDEAVTYAHVNKRKVTIEEVKS